MSWTVARTPVMRWVDDIYTAYFEPVPHTRTGDEMSGGCKFGVGGSHNEKILFWLERKTGAPNQGAFIVGSRKANRIGTRSWERLS